MKQLILAALLTIATPTIGQDMSRSEFPFSVVMTCAEMSTLYAQLATEAIGYDDETKFVDDVMQSSGDNPPQIKTIIVSLAHLAWKYKGKVVPHDGAIRVMQSCLSKNLGTPV